MKNWILPLSILLLAGCSTAVTDVMPDEILFTPSVSTKVTETSFESGDNAGLYVAKWTGISSPALLPSGNFATNTLLSCEDGVWRSNPKLFWEEGIFDFYAYSPFMSRTPEDVANIPFKVALDQSRYDDFMASDFLVARSVGISRMDAVPLTFSHRMSRLDITLTKGESYSGGLPDCSGIAILNTVPDAVIDLAAGDVVKNPRSMPDDIIPYRTGPYSWSVILVPQRLDDLVPFVEMTVGHVSLVVEYAIVLKPGTRYQLNFVLKDNPDKVNIDIDAFIKEWE